ncbi:MAG: hypothetical protein MJZ20_01560 [Bacteroidaceae bacterium]|nr:hypothetical protein [Bacteroidaceae bacterium]
MRWGVRRYQNPDGTLTEAGRKHYGYGEATRSETKATSAVTKRRRNPNGTLTEAERKRYNSGKLTESERKDLLKDFDYLRDAYNKAEDAKHALEEAKQIEKDREVWKSFGYKDKDIDAKIAKANREASKYKSTNRDSLKKEMNKTTSSIKSRLKTAKYGSVDWFNIRDEYYKAVDSYGERMAKAFMDDIGYTPTSIFSAKKFAEWMGVGEGYGNSNSDYRSITDPITGKRDYDLVDPRKKSKR